MINNINQEQFNIIKNNSEIFYKKLDSVYCPYFKEYVFFNSKGLEHLKFKKKNHARVKKDQFIRFKILKYAPEILRKTSTIQGISEQKVFELSKNKSKKEYVLIDAMFFEFIAVVDKIRIRVIVKQLKNSHKYFWSIIPFWKNNKNGIRKLHYGIPEED